MRSITRDLIPEPGYLLLEDVIFSVLLRGAASHRTWMNIRGNLASAARRPQYRTGGLYRA
jgi:hypothetical protein